MYVFSDVFLFMYFREQEEAVSRDECVMRLRKELTLLRNKMESLERVSVPPQSFVNSNILYIILWHGIIDRNMPIQ